ARPVRWLVWLTAGLLVAAGAGLVVAHAKPTWMRRLHLARVPHAHVAVPPTTSSPSAHRAGAAAGSSIVSTGIPGPTGTTVTVRAQSYTVLVQAIAPCWVMATTPQSATPAFNATMAPGTSQVLTPVNGQLTVELGASGVLVSVKVGAKSVPGWSYAPTSAPVTLVFTNTPAPNTP
ncbi:MAG TPA: hypothetical protein VMU09_02745, partial [Acidimicrobiales bacterium]|nr:hypothetical protein [Acidimicrobiales bacterium]